MIEVVEVIAKEFRYYFLTCMKVYLFLIIRLEEEYNLLSFKEFIITKVEVEGFLFKYYLAPYYFKPIGDEGEGEEVVEDCQETMS